MYDAVFAAACLGAFVSAFVAIPLAWGVVVRLFNWAARLDPHREAGKWRRLVFLMADEGTKIEDADDVIMLLEDLRGRTPVYDAANEQGLPQPLDA